MVLNSPNAQAQLQEKVQQTREARATAALLAAEVQALHQAWEQEHALLLETFRLAREIQQDCEHQTRQLAVQIYKEAPEQGKQICPGVSVRERISLHYDSKEALAWAQERHSLAVTPPQLNVDVFEQLARLFPETMPFVTRTTSYTILLSKQL